MPLLGERRLVMKTNRSYTTSFNRIGEVKTPAMTEWDKEMLYREVEYGIHRRARRRGHARREREWKDITIAKGLLAVVLILSIVWIAYVSYCQDQSWKSYQEQHKSQEFTVQLDDGSWVTDEHFQSIQYAQEHPEQFGGME